MLMFRDTTDDDTCLANVTIKTRNVGPTAPIVDLFFNANF